MHTKEGQPRILMLIVVTCHDAFSHTNLHKGPVLQISCLAISLLEGVALKEHGQILPSEFPNPGFDGSKANKIDLVNRF